MNGRTRTASVLRSHLERVTRDLMTGVSFMIPFVTVGGIFLAVASLLGGSTLADPGSLRWFLSRIGRTSLSLVFPVLGGYVAYAIADRPGLAPGFVLSALVQQGAVVSEAGLLLALPTGEGGAGVLGALATGLLAGVVTRGIARLSVPNPIAPMMPVLVVPVASTAVLALPAVFVVGVPFSIANAALITTLETVRGGIEAAILGAVLGAMMASDVGGPVNKVAYVFAVGVIADGIYEPMAAVMIAGMTPPIGVALASALSPETFGGEAATIAERGVALGAAFVTEGALPYASADPLRIVPALAAGSAAGAAASMAAGVTMPAPHGGVLVVPLSNHPFLFVGCLLLGTVVTAAAILAVRPNVDDVTLRVEVGAGRTD